MKNCLLVVLADKALIAIQKQEDSTGETTLLAIPRGVIYHHLCDDFKRLFSCWTAQLDDIKAVKEFEGEFARLLGRKHCVAFPFARTAIYFILKAKNLPSGAEVIMPPITIKAILDVVL